jgi:hypothetical protein
MDEKTIYSYTVERADGYIYKLESDQEASILLETLRKLYLQKTNNNLLFCQHLNRIPVAIYKLEVKNERTLD